MMKSDGIGRDRARVTAASRPRPRGNATRSKMFGLTPLAGQARIDARGRRRDVAGKQVADHETDRVIPRVLAGRETVDAFGDVLSTEISPIPGDPFALDDRVRIMFVAVLPDVVEEDRHVRPPVRPENLWTRTRFRSPLDDHLPVPVVGRPLPQRRPHPVPKALRDLHLASTDMHAGMSGCESPALADHLQYPLTALAVDVDERPSKGSQPRRHLEASRPPTAVRAIPHDQVTRPPGRTHPTSSGGPPA